MIRIIIADDHAIVRQGLRQILQFDPTMEIVGEAQNGNEVLDLVRNIPVDVVVLDITMPGRDGLETLKELKKLKEQFLIGSVVTIILRKMH